MENSKIRGAWVGISDQWDFQQTDCFLHKDKGANIYTDEVLKDSEDNCKIGGSKLGKAVICQRSLAEGFGQYNLLTNLSVKTRQTSNFRNLTTEARLLTTIPYDQVDIVLIISSDKCYNLNSEPRRVLCIRRCEETGQQVRPVRVP